MSAALADLLADRVPDAAVETWEDGEGGAPLPLVAPATEAGFQAAIDLARAEGLRVLPLGSGSKRRWIRAPEHVDLVLSTRRYAGVVSYEPADGTVTALAGTPMADLAAVVAEGGHHLSPAVPDPASSTLGGVVAAGQSGDDRLRYGALRENLLGTRVLLADGSVARSGGQLVKNVTGYDLHRLHCGSSGSLCLVLEASLRLYPLPDERAIAHVSLPDRGEALALCRALHECPLRPVTLLAHDLDASAPGLPWTVLLVLAGAPEVVERELEEVRALVPAATVARGPEAEPVARRVRDLERPGGAWPPLSIETRPSALAAVLEGVVHEAGAAGYAVRLLLHPALARAAVWLLPGADDAPDADLLAPERVRALDERLARLPLVARWRDLPRAARAAVQPLGRPGPGRETMAALRAALDPTGVFAPRLFGPDV